VGEAPAVEATGVAGVAATVVKAAVGGGNSHTPLRRTRHPERTIVPLRS